MWKTLNKVPIKKRKYNFIHNFKQAIFWLPYELTVFNQHNCTLFYVFCIKLFTCKPKNKLKQTIKLNEQVRETN